MADRIRRRRRLLFSGEAGTRSGKAAVVFLDVWKDQAPARRFGIRTIPTQIFFDEKGKEVYRHEGLMSEEEIVSRFKEMGVK